MDVQIPDVFSSWNTMERAARLLQAILLNRLEEIAEAAEETAEKIEKFRDPDYWSEWLKDPENLMLRDPTPPTPSLEEMIKSTKMDMNDVREEQLISESMLDSLKDEAKGILELLTLIQSKSYAQIAMILRQEVSRRKKVFASLKRSLCEPLSPRLGAAIIANIEFYKFFARVFDP